MICSQKKSKKESRYNIIMTNEIELKLAEINKKLNEASNNSELKLTLEEFKEWLEGMLINYCE